MAQGRTCRAVMGKRDIPFINFTIHEIHCKRNISVCKLCKEPFPTSDMEEHLDTEHAPVTCKCKMTIEKRDLEEHELSACSLRLVKCVFCELELAFNKLGEHVDYCGARTECCEKCGRSVMKKDLVDHPEVCAPKKPPRVHSVVSSDLDTDGAWFEWNVRNSFMDPIKKILFYLWTTLLRFSESLQCGMFCIKSLSLGNLLFLVSQTILNRSKSFTTKQPEQKVIAPSLPCEFCDKLIPEHDLILHQSGCNQSAFASVFNGRSSPKPQRDYQLESNFDWLSKPSVQSKPPVSSSPPPLNNDPYSVLIPCEFCGIVLEHDVVFHHQDQCDMGPNSGTESSLSTRLPSKNNYYSEKTGLEEKLSPFLSHEGECIFILIFNTIMWIYFRKCMKRVLYTKRWCLLTLEKPCKISCISVLRNVHASQNYDPNSKK
uniref:TRAF-type zinc finger domain-containing protein 1 n=1 Tax=Leptobrachium leishanense TaxID=445787 RepID=A0A8C5PC84_9ANUR